MQDSYESTMRPWLSALSDTSERELPATATAETKALAALEQLAFAHTQSMDGLKSILLARIHTHTHKFFEILVLDLLVAMGYASGSKSLARHLGRSHDGGVDGLVAQDELGIEAIYLQAKRIKPGSTVPVSDVRNFVGSLEAHHARKGVFLTTGHFSHAAEDFVTAVPHRLVLVNGTYLVELMIRHNIGVKVTETFQFKSIDPKYFAPPVT